MSDPAKLPIAMKGSLPEMAKGYMSGNVLEGRDDLTRDNYAALDFKRWLHDGTGYKYRGAVADWKANHSPLQDVDVPRTQSATEGAELVLSLAGASLSRDAVDQRVTDNVRKRRGKLIDSQAEVGGWPKLGSKAAPSDQDRDGMPDTWEKAHGLNPTDPTDRNADRDGDGYTNLEKYLNSLCAP